MYERIEEPDEEPIDLDEAKLQCRVDGDEEDDLITSFIKAARESCENFCNRVFVLQTWKLTLDAFPLPQPSATSPSILVQVIALDKPWVRTVDSVKYFDGDGVQQTMDSGDYRLVSGPALPGQLMPAFGQSWPSARADVGVIEVEFTAGWDDAEAVPEAIKQAIRFMVGHFYANRESVVVGSIATEIPQACEHLLWPYRNL